MFGPGYSAGCPACSAIADGFNGFAIHLANHDVMLWAVSRAPLAKLHGYKQRMGWSFPWASSSGSDLNDDFDVSLTEEQERAGAFEYNFRESPVWSPPTDVRGPFDAWAATTGTDWATYTRERPGMSAFALEDGVVYHTYSAYARGLDGLWACTSGSTERREGGTRRAAPTTRSTGTAATTSTITQTGPASNRTRVADPAAYNHPDHSVRARPGPPL